MILNYLYPERLGLVLQSSTRTSAQHARHGFKSQIDHTAIRRSDCPAMGRHQLVIESQAHKWYRQALNDNS